MNLKKKFLKFMMFKLILNIINENTLICIERYEKLQKIRIDKINQLKLIEKQQRDMIAKQLKKNNNI